MEDQIQHISDTAFWIAAYRAEETERPDAVINDHLAKKLAGERGDQMVKATPYTKSMAFAMIVRTVAIDRLIETAIEKGVDTVINLGAGLDTRPYRMKLPPWLQWIEVDFQNLIDYKNEKLKSDIPICRLQRIACDLSDVAERKKLFNKLSYQTSKAVVITEGVIGYITNDEAASLSKDIFSVPSFNYWIFDYSRGKFRKTKQTKKLFKKLKNTPIKFSHPEPLQFFSGQGWKVEKNLFILDEADRLGRKLPLMFPWNVIMTLFPKRLKAVGNKTYGYAMLDKANHVNSIHTGA